MSARTRMSAQRSAGSNSVMSPGVRERFAVSRSAAARSVDVPDEPALGKQPLRGGADHVPLRHPVLDGLALLRELAPVGLQPQALRALLVRDEAGFRESHVPVAHYARASGLSEMRRSRPTALVPQIRASRPTVSGKRSTSRISKAAWALGRARPCSQFSSVRRLVRR